jgi:hypothetical protein
MLGSSVHWTKSSFSADITCVEIALHNCDVLVWDTKDPDGPFLRFRWTSEMSSVTTSPPESPSGVMSSFGGGGGRRGECFLP